MSTWGPPLPWLDNDEATHADPQRADKWKFHQSGGSMHRARRRLFSEGASWIGGGGVGGVSSSPTFGPIGSPCIALTLFDIITEQIIGKPFLG